jgi:hypothetical protein
MLRDISFQLDVKRNRTREVPSSTFGRARLAKSRLYLLPWRYIRLFSESLLVGCCVLVSGLPHAVRDAEIRTRPSQAQWSVLGFVQDQRLSRSHGVLCHRRPPGPRNPGYSLRSCIFYRRWPCSQRVSHYPIHALLKEVQNGRALWTR